MKGFGPDFRPIDSDKVIENRSNTNVAHRDIPFKLWLSLTHIKRIYLNGNMVAVVSLLNHHSC